MSEFKLPKRGNIFFKLDLAPDDHTDRRVAAVLRYLESA